MHLPQVKNLEEVISEKIQILTFNICVTLWSQVLIFSFPNFLFRRASHSVCLGVLSNGGFDITTTKYSPAMHEKYARKLYQASTHFTWRLYFCWNWCLGIAGKIFISGLQKYWKWMNWFLIKLKTLTNMFLFTIGWILYLLKLYKIVWRLWHPTCNESLRKQHHN